MNPLGLCLDVVAALASLALAMRALSVAERPSSIEGIVGICLIVLALYYIGEATVSVGRAISRRTE